MTTKTHDRAHSSNQHAHAERATHNGGFREELSALSETAKESAHQLGEGGVRVARSAGMAVREAVDELKEEGTRRWDSAAKDVGKAISKNPFMAVGIAAGIGAVLALGMTACRRR